MIKVPFFQIFLSQNPVGNFFWALPFFSEVLKFWDENKMLDSGGFIQKNIGISLDSGGFIQKKF